MFTFVDLFAGCGGFSLGLKKAGGRLQFAIEYDKWAFKTFRFNLVRSSSDWNMRIPMRNFDIFEFISKYCSQILSLMGKIDLFVGGPPCQGFSISNNSASIHDPRNKLYETYLFLIDKVRPKFLLIENVQGMLRKFNIDQRGTFKKSIFFHALYRDLNHLGYTIQYKIVGMSDFGIPQKRKRLIIFAHRNDLPEVSFFQELYKRREAFLKERNLPIDRALTFGDAASDLGEEPYTGPETPYQELMANGSIPKNHAPKKLNDTTRYDFLYSLYAIKGFKTREISAYTRSLHCQHETRIFFYENTPTTLTTNLKYYHSKMKRHLTTREIARIQSFPDSFIFPEPISISARLIGNAVPPLFSEIAGLVLHEHL